MSFLFWERIHLHKPFSKTENGLLNPEVGLHFTVAAKVKSKAAVSGKIPNIVI